MSTPIFDIFISYRNDAEGKAIGRAIKRTLDARNYSVYFNPDEQTEEYFTDELRGAIEGCKDFVLVISQGYMDRVLENAQGDWICAEIRLARERNKHFVPMLIDGVSLPKRQEMWPEELCFLHHANYISCPCEPERFPTAPAEFLEKKLTSLPEKGDRFRDAFNSNRQYDVRADYLKKLEEADGGSLEAVYELSLMYFYGFTDEEGRSVRDYEKAFQCFRKLEETGKDYAEFGTNMIGHMCYSGTIPRDSQSYRQSLLRHQFVAEVLPAAAQHAAYMMSIGSGCEFDYEKTVAFYEKIAQGSDNSVKFNLAEFYVRYGEFDKAASLYREMYVSNADAAIQLGLLYKRGILAKPYKPDYFMASYYFQHAMQLEGSNPQAYYELGTLYFNPTGNFPKDFRLAEKNLTIAADLGHREAQYVLGYMYDNGHVEKNYEKAIYYHELAAAQGQMQSAAQLSLLYQQPGYENYQKAWRYAKLAASTGMSMGEFLYGNMLFLGRGCEADMNEAYVYYRRAYEHGFTQAKVMMDKIDAILGE